MHNLDTRKATMQALKQPPYHYIILENPLWAMNFAEAYYVRDSYASGYYTVDSYTFYNHDIQNRFMGFVATEGGTTAAMLAVNTLLASGTYTQIQGYQNSSNDFNRGVYDGYHFAMAAIVLGL